MRPPAPPPGGPRGQGRQLLRGAFLLARLRPEGMAAFGNTQAAFLASFLPLLAFPLGGFLFGLIGGAGLAALTGLLATLVALLAPPVVTEALARRWGRENAWLRYATAFNWTRWPLLLALPFAVALAGLLAQAGFSPSGALGLAMAAFAAYGAVLDWFVARTGLGLSGGRAVLVVVAVNLAVGVLFLGPGLLADWTVGNSTP